MRVIIRDDYEKACEWVAQYVRKRIADFKPIAKRPFVLGLPTGSTPIGVYKRLVQLHKAGHLSFKHVVTFNMDEYVGLPKNHEQSYHSFMWSHLFKHIDILPENAHILNGNAKDLEKECGDYEAAIKAVGGIELFLGGVGHDGHVAFNEPGSSLTSRTRVKTLAYETIVANARFFENDIKKVPNMALTVGVGTIMDAREVLIVVTGTSKAAALAKCMEEGVNHMYTMSAIQMHPKSCIVCDEDATGELRVRTVKYFKGLERVHQLLIGKPLAGHLTQADEDGDRHEKKLKISVSDSAPTATAVAAAAPAPAARPAAAAAASAEAEVPTPSQRKSVRPKSAGGKKAASAAAHAAAAARAAAAAAAAAAQATAPAAAAATAVPQSPFPASPGVPAAAAAAAEAAPAEAVAENGNGKAKGKGKAAAKKRKSKA